MVTSGILDENNYEKKSWRHEQQVAEFRSPNTAVVANGSSRAAPRGTKRS